MSIYYDEVFCEVNGVAMQILEQAGCYEPPVNAFQVADALDSAVYIDDGIETRGATLLVDDQYQIQVRTDPRVERMQFTAAHEIAEQYAGDLSKNLGVESPRFVENVANYLAGAILVPRAWLTTAIKDVGYSVPRLKAEYFSTASHEVIARRLLTLDEPMVLTIFDTELQCPTKMFLRVGNCECTDRLIGIERRAWEECRESREIVCHSDGQLSVTVWPVDDPETGWQREILRTTPAW